VKIIKTCDTTGNCLRFLMGEAVKSPLEKVWPNQV